MDSGVHLEGSLGCLNLSSCWCCSTICTLLNTDDVLLLLCFIDYTHGVRYKQLSDIWVIKYISIKMSYVCQIKPNQIIINSGSKLSKVCRSNRQTCYTFSFLGEWAWSWLWEENGHNFGNRFCCSFIPGFLDARDRGIGVARGCIWCTCNAPGRRKAFRRNLQGKFVSAPPAHQVQLQAEQESSLGHLLLCGEDLELQLAVLDRLLKATTKKGRQLSWGKKCTPRQNPGYAYGSGYKLKLFFRNSKSDPVTDHAGCDIISARNFWLETFTSPCTCKLRHLTVI